MKPFRQEDLKEKVEKALLKSKAQIQVQRDFDRAEQLSRSSHWAEALNAYALVIAVDPNHVATYLGMANAQKHLAPEKAIPNATQYVRQAISIDPTCEQAHIDLALIFESAMSIDKSIATLKDSLTACAFSARIQFHLGRLLLRRGHQVEGLKAVQKALELKPDIKEAKDILSGRPE